MLLQFQPKRVDIIIHDVVKDEKKIIEDLEFLGSARLVLLPLLAKYPFVGGFIFQFYERIIFCTNANHNLLDLKDAQLNLLKDFIEQKVNQILFNQTYKIHGNFVEESVYQKAIFHAPVLLCYLNLVEILNLDNSNLSNNYTYFCLCKLGDTIHHTKSIRNTVSPKFNETFVFPVHDLHQAIVIKLFAKKYESEHSICIGKLSIRLPAREANVNDVDAYLKNVFNLNPTFTGQSFWLPFKVKHQPNRQAFVNLKIALMSLTSDSTKFVDRTLIQFTKNQQLPLPVIVINVALTNINLDYTNKHTQNKLNKNQLLRILANFNGNYQTGHHFYIKNNSSSIGRSIRDARFRFIVNSSIIHSTTNDLNFEIELLNLNGQREIVPGRVNVKLNDFVLSRKNNLMKNLTFQTPRLNKLNPTTFGTAELYLTIQTVLIDHSVLENLLIAPKPDELAEYLRPQNINLISYYSSYSEKLKQLNLDKELNEFVPDLQFKTKRAKLKKEPSKQSKLNLIIPDQPSKEDDCEILLVFHYPSNQLLLVDVIRLINVPVFSRNSLPNPALLIEMWKDKSRVAYSLTETKYKTRDPFYSIQVQFEINANKLSNLFLRILILEHAKKTFISKDKSQFLAESFIKIPELEIGNSSEPKWFKFNRIGIY